MAGMDLGKQVGPLPLGAWVAVVAGGLGIALWSKNNSASDTPVITEDTSGDAGVGTGGSDQWTNLDVPTTDTTDTAIVYQTNEAWGQAAVNWLIAQGYASAISNSAITKALAGGTDINGNKMSVQEWTLWGIALGHMGSPPYPVSVSPPVSVPGPVDTGTATPVPTPVTPKPTPTPVPTTPKPPTNKIPAHHTVKAVRGDSISKIGARYGKSWQTVWNFNLKYRDKATVAVWKARGPNLIFAGTTVWVPV